MTSSGLYRSSGTLAIACPRCEAEGTVELLVFKSPITWFIGTLLVGAVILHWWAPEYGAEAQMATAIAWFLHIVWGRITHCKSCGAHLQREIGQGWR